MKTRFLPTHRQENGHPSNKILNSKSKLRSYQRCSLKLFYEKNCRMSQQTEYEMLLEEKCEIDNRIDNLVGDMDIFPDVYEEYGVGNYEWSPRNETRVLWACKDLKAKLAQLEVRRRKISRKFGALTKTETRYFRDRWLRIVKKIGRDV